MLPHLDAARARGWQVDVACNVTRDPEITKAHCDNLISVPFARNPLHPKNLIATIKLIQLIRKEKYDIVHCHNPSGGFYGRLAATMSGVKCLRVYTAHGFHFHPLGSRISNFIYRFVEGFAGKFISDAVLTINKWDFEEAKKIMPVKKIFFTHGVGVSTDFFNPALVTEEKCQEIRREFRVPDGGLLVTCIGEMIPRKRHEDAVLGFANIADLEDSVLALIGDGVLRSKLELQIKNEPRVRFPGFRRDICEILAASDVFIFPSLQEGLPCAVQEALSMEVPVVSYAIRGCTDMIDDSCGRAVPYEIIPGRCSAPCLDLGSALQSLLLLSPGDRKEMGRAGRRKMIELYDRPKCVAEVLAIYDKLLAPRPPVMGEDEE